MTDAMIIESYMDLFDVDSGAARSMMELRFQFNGPGWLGLMAGLCERLVPLAQGTGFRIMSVKSKLGTLRIASRDGTDVIDVEIAAAKSIALVTCELCGAPGIQQTVGGWVMVRCGACAG
jgi:hypothetical protein